MGPFFKFMESSRILVLLGPTATGKTELALQLALKFQGELVSADSRQVYVGLDIGTGKTPSGNEKREMRRESRRWEVGGIKVWMYDVVNPKIQYSVADYVKEANKVIGEIRERGKLPIIVGGTGLYLKALLEGLPNLAIPINKNLRRELQKLSLNELQKRLQTFSIKRWEKMNQSDRGNPRRLVRAIELESSPRRSSFDFSSTSLTAGAQDHLRGVSSRDDVLKIGLTATREVLYKRADERVVTRINQGMIEETKRMHKNGISLNRMKQLGLEYGVLADYLEGKITDKEELVRKLQGKIHNFIRRQLTWFKNEKNLPAGRQGISWVNITDQQFPKNVEKAVAKWYHPR